METQKDEVFDDGGRVFLRALHEDDVNETYLSWFQDETVTEFLDAKYITRDDAIQYMRRGRETREHFMYALIAKDFGEHIGNIKIGPMEWRDLNSCVIVIIGKREYWGQGIATEAIQLGNRVAFDVYGIRKLSGGIVDGNIASVRAYTGAGWAVEGRLKGQSLINGEARDGIVVSCFSPRFFPSRQVS